MRHVLSRGALLVAIGLFLNLYPRFDFATVRIPGVLQRIGLCYMLTGAFMLSTARVEGTRLLFRFRPLVVAAVVVLVSYWLLLYFVPVPGFGAPRFDPVGSWPPVVDRAVIGVQHFFQHWPVDGKVVFDPEGILSTWPSCFNVLLGALAGLTYSRGNDRRGLTFAFHRRRRRDDGAGDAGRGSLSAHQEPLDQHLRAVQRRIRARAARRAHAGLASGPSCGQRCGPRASSARTRCSRTSWYSSPRRSSTRSGSARRGADDAAQRRPGVVQHVRRAARGFAAVRALRHRR